MLSAERTSDVMAQLACSVVGERVSVQDILATLKNRAFALMLVLLGLPNCLPMPPPIALISGFLVAFIAVQMSLGFTVPWLPRYVLSLTVGRDALERTLKKATPLIRSLERFAKPRLTFLETLFGFRIIGIVLFILALAMIFAVPVIGQIPLGIAICLIGLGLVERDGILVISGIAIGAIGAAISGSVVSAIIVWLSQFIR